MGWPQRCFSKVGNFTSSSEFLASLESLGDPGTLTLTLAMPHCWQEAPISAPPQPLSAGPGEPGCQQMNWHVLAADCPAQCLRLQRAGIWGGPILCSIQIGLFFVLSRVFDNPDPHTAVNSPCNHLTKETTPPAFPELTIPWQQILSLQRWCMVKGSTLQKPKI